MLVVVSGFVFFKVSRVNSQLWKTFNSKKTVNAKRIVKRNSRRWKWGIEMSSWHHSVITGVEKSKFLTKSKSHIPVWQIMQVSSFPFCVAKIMLLKRYVDNLFLKTLSRKFIFLHHCHKASDFKPSSWLKLLTKSLFNCPCNCKTFLVLNKVFKSFLNEVTPWNQKLDYFSSMN